MIFTKISFLRLEKNWKSFNFEKQPTRRWWRFDHFITKEARVPSTWSSSLELSAFPGVLNEDIISGYKTGRVACFVWRTLIFITQSLDDLIDLKLWFPEVLLNLKFWGHALFNKYGTLPKDVCLNVTGGQYRTIIFWY